MDYLAGDPDNCFVGYGLARGGALGTLKDVPREQIKEMPTAENLMMGAAIGLSLAGKKPVVYFERADFLWNASDAIVNHLDKAREISCGQFTPACIIRVTIGNRMKPLFTGVTHTQNNAAAFKFAVENIQVFVLAEQHDPLEFYKIARDRQNKGLSTMIYEHKDLI